jgi:hypothetical protein
MTYIKNSKTSEAKTNLSALAQGATAYYETEHTKTKNGMSMFTKVYPHCGSDPTSTKDAELTACSEKAVGTAASNGTIGVKFDPTNKTIGDFSAKPWNDLNFVITKPYYYYYVYSTKMNTAGGAGATAADSEFMASASASLSDVCDSVYTIHGDKEGKVGALVDISGDSTGCNHAVID